MRGRAAAKLAMRVLWVVGFVVPQAARLVGRDPVPFGGWVEAMIDLLSCTEEVNLAVAMRAPIRERVSERIGNVDYYALPATGAGAQDIAAVDCQYALAETRPDLVHIEGTECHHARTFLGCWRGRSLVELQGVINGHQAHQYGGLSLGDLFLSGDPVKAAVAAAMVLKKRLRFLPRVRAEAATIAMSSHIVGRTTWDRAHAYALNPTATYHRCHHVLRSPFYRTRWALPGAERFSLFVGNASSALKGVHFLLQAIARLQREFPRLKLYVAGEDPFRQTGRTLRGGFGYGAYLRRLVADLGLRERIHFTGMLNASEMADRMARCHAVVMPSVIENSPVTLSEAMIMGVPSIAAYAGGTPDMATDGEEALFYRDNDPVMLAFQIKRVFEDDALAETLSERSRQRAADSHSPDACLRTLLGIYGAVMRDPAREENGEVRRH